MIHVPTNTYVVSQECREEVVQMIVNAFVQQTESIIGNTNNTVLPIETGVEVVEHIFSGRQNDLLYCFLGPYIGREHTILKRYKIHSCEVREAVRMMIDAGYYFYEGRYGYRKQLLYVKCHKRVREPRTLEWHEKRIFTFDYIME